MDVSDAMISDAEIQKEQARHYIRMTRMASGVAHKLRNILMVARSYQEMAEAGMPADMPAVTYIQKAGQTLNEIQSFCNSMQLYTGRGLVAACRLDLNQLIQAGAAEFEAGLPAHIECRCFPADQPLLLKGDYTAIKKMFQNLLANAWMACNKVSSGQIRVTADYVWLEAEAIPLGPFGEIPPPGPYAWLEVSDNGCGIPADILPKLFDPFFSHAFNGQGLGLAEVYGILWAHKGFVRIDSQPGEGTTIRVMLPAIKVETGFGDKPHRQAQTNAPDTLQQSPAAAEKPRVLVIDDQEAILKISRRMLELLGLEVLTASQSHEGIELFKTHSDKIGCVIADLSMPEIDGMGIMSEIRKIRPDVRVIIASGFAEDQIADQTAQAPPDAFVQKPFEKNKFQMTVNKLMSGAMSKE